MMIEVNSLKFVSDERTLTTSRCHIFDNSVRDFQNSLCAAFPEILLWFNPTGS